MRPLDQLIDDYITWTMEESPVTASYVGIDGYDDRLPDVSAAGFARRIAAEDDWTARFDALDDADLEHAERVDRDAVLAHLRGSAIMRDWEVWRRNPDTYLTPGLMGVFSLFLRRLSPDPELAAAAAARMRAVPEVLDHGRTNLDPGRVSPIFVARALGQARAAVTYSRELVPDEVDDPELKSMLADAGEVAAEAYESYAAFLEDLGDRAAGDYAIGEERYTALLKEREQLDFTADGLRQRGQEAWTELDIELRDVARQVGGRDDWRAVLDEVNADHPSTPDEMLGGYAEWTARARAFLEEHELVTLPEGEACQVVPSPPFQRPVLAVASYFGPPPFKPSLVGRFNVPFPPEATSDEEVQQRLADNSWASIPTTSVHEAYPGHHWHYALMQSPFGSADRRIRLLHSTAYFTEGWALYAERMMREEGFFDDPRFDLCHLDARIFRAARIVVDTSLHMGDM
ncbi:MAG: DUF885 domain-containing protein, partial [Chloroflexi bacterium]|nr:DUF885 domain-containing protein [Chloroflexota bacterium]